MKAKDIMQRHVVTATPAMTLAELADLLDEHHITGAPVVGPQGHLVGVVSLTDLFHGAGGPRSVAAYHQKEPRPAPRAGGSPARPAACVEDVMTPWVVSFEEDTPVTELVQQMLRKRIHRVVITRDGRLAGIVTSMDMLKAVLMLSRLVRRRPDLAPSRRSGT